MPPGKQHVVTIQQPTVTKDAATNESIVSWSTWRTVFGSAQARRGKEFFVEGQRFAESVMRFEFHWEDAKGVTERMRLLFEGVSYDIKSVLHDHEREQFITVEATATA